MLNQFIAFLTPKIDPAMRDYEGTSFCCTTTQFHLPQICREGHQISIATVESNILAGNYPTQSC